uniref:Minor capsid protein n=1 Tax=Gokushovirinae environmental samples TaxID=1478972 RepID=A0A2R3UAA4_9VIRU|nr:minor capsid protein [Gokushovirinae environmental samples]
MDQQKPNKIVELRPNGTKRVATVPVGETRCQRQFKDQCNVNKIIEKFKRTGSVTHVRNAHDGVYMDLTELPSLQEAQEVIIAATKAFEAVPASIRQRFGHDPQQFINFLEDPNNNEEAIKLGLKVPKSTPKPDPVLTELQTLNKTLTTQNKVKKVTSNKV